MAALDFPSSPSLNQIYNANGLTWQWDGATWDSVGAISGATAVASEALTIGNFVNLYNVGGTPTVRKADASLGYEAHGFVSASYASSATATVQLSGTNINVSGLTAGDVWLGNAGAVTNTAPSTVGYLSQQIGVATLATAVVFLYEPGVTLQAVPATVSGVNGMVRLAQVITSGSQATVDFTSISASYTNLFVVWSAQDTTVSNQSTNLRVMINNDTTAGNYTATSYSGNVNNAAGNTTTGASAIGVQVGLIPQANSTSNHGSGTVTFATYSGTSFHKRILAVGGTDDVGGSSYLLTMMARWKVASAINRVTFGTEGTAFTNGSVFTLYGLL